MRYPYIIEKTETGFAAYLPDLPGYGCSGKTIEEVRKLVSEGVPFHLAGLRHEGIPVPQPSSIIEYVDIA